MALGEVIRWIGFNLIPISFSILILFVGSIVLELILAELARYLPRESPTDPNHWHEMIAKLLWLPILFAAIWPLTSGDFYGVLKLTMASFLIAIFLRNIFANLASGVLLRFEHSKGKHTPEGTIKEIGWLQSLLTKGKEHSIESNSYVFEARYLERRAQKAQKKYQFYR